MGNTTPAERRLAAQMAANLSWGNTEDRAARTAPARRSFDQKFLEQAGGDPKRAESLRRAYYQQLAFKSAQARRRAREAAALAEQATRDELDALGGESA